MAISHAATGSGDAYGYQTPSDSPSHVRASWADFLSRYARGEFPSDTIPPLPPLPSLPPEHVRPSSEPLDHLFEAPTYDTIDITPSIAERVGEFYCKHAFLPPPRAPSEAVRERVILEYDLYSQEQIDNIQAATDLVQAYFGGLCTFTLFRDNVQVLMAVSGDSTIIEAVGLHPGKRLLPETSLCGHQVLFRRRSMYVPDLASDWRTAGNPYADALKGVKSYLGAAVFLPVDPVQSPSSVSNTVPWPAKEDTGKEVSGVGVGVINLMHLDEYLPPPTPSQEKVLHHVTRMLETQLRATWEGHARTKEARARRTVCEYIDQRLVPRSGTSSGPNRIVPISVETTGRPKEVNGLVQEVQSTAGPSTETRTSAGARPPAIVQPRSALLPASGESPTSSGPQSRPSSLRAPQRVSTPLSDAGIESDPIFSAAQDVCDRIKYVLNEAEVVSVVDLRAVQRVRNPSGTVHPQPYTVHDDPIFPIQVHGWSCSTGQPPPDLSDPSAISAILAFLVMHRSSAEELFDAESKPSGLEHFLPPSTRSQLVVPFSIADEPAFLIIVTTSKQFWTFRGTEANLVRSMGVVLRAQVVQRRLVEADAAKTVFLSSVSHELRTPLHGLMTGLQLVAESLRHGEPEHALRLLPMVESSGQTLQQILDDILDFGKMMHTRSSAGQHGEHGGGSDGLGSGSTSPSSEEGGLTDGVVAPPSSSPPISDSRRRVQEADLARDVMDAARTCWPRIVTRGNVDQDARQGLRETIERGLSVGESVGSRLDAEARRDVELVVEWEERDWRCMIDQVAFQRILFNGLTNAIKFTKSGTVLVSLQTLPIDGRPGSKTPVLLTVTDTGPGIPPALLSRLFRPFTKGDSFVPGTGLGLFIMRELVEGMEGRVGLTSEEGRGTELRVELPVEFLPEVGAGQRSESRAMRRVTISDEFSLTQRQDPPSVGSIRPPLRRTSPKTSDANAKLVPAAAPPAAGIRPFRVLVVDDNDISRALLVALIQRLKDPSIVVKQAQDGVDGLDVYQSFLPQLVATDVSMPEMDGIAMSTAIREFEREQNIVQPAQIYAITGLGSSDPRLKAGALKGGAELDGWLVKGKESLASMRQIVLDAKRRHDAGSIVDVQGGPAGMTVHATPTVATSTVANPPAVL